MKKLVIMTTAIIRPNLHNISIGEFYKNYYLNDKFLKNLKENYEIHHIINIDSPKNLLNHFSREETISNFEKIIPEEIKKVYILPERPNFLFAYKNIMKKIKELNLINEDYFYWWLEDDWIIKPNDFNFIENSLEILQFKNCCLTSTYNTPLGSFRGGPIMNGNYFINYFNIEELGVMNNTCDPEKQVSKYITSKKGIINSQKLKNYPDLIVRELKSENEKIINIALVFKFSEIEKIHNNFLDFFYEKNFNEEIKFNYWILIVDSEIIYYLNYDKNIDFKKIENYLIDTYKNFITKTDNSSIWYFMVNPYIIEDCGRKFAKEYNLVKTWVKIGDEITYN